MSKHKCLSVVILITILTNQGAQASNSYPSCLMQSLTGNHNFSLEEVRALCYEIAGVQNPVYTWEEGELKPSGPYTECFDREKRELTVLGEEKAKEIAKTLCRYEPSE